MLKVSLVSCVARERRSKHKKPPAHCARAALRSSSNGDASSSSKTFSRNSSSLKISSRPSLKISSQKTSSPPSSRSSFSQSSSLLKISSRPFWQAPSLPLFSQELFSQPSLPALSSQPASSLLVWEPRSPGQHRFRRPCRHRRRRQKWTPLLLRLPRIRLRALPCHRRLRVRIHPRRLHTVCNRPASTCPPGSESILHRCMSMPEFRQNPCGRIIATAFIPRYITARVCCVPQSRAVRCEGWPGAARQNEMRRPVSIMRFDLI